MNQTPAEQQRHKAYDDVNSYLRAKNCGVETLFVTAYMAYFGGVLDRYEVQANLDRFRQTLDPPPYVRAFLVRTIQ